MVDAVVKNVVAHRERLGMLVQVLKAQGPISLNLATFWAAKRTSAEAGTGCALGHFVKNHRPRHLELVPLTWLEQLKSPLHSDRELAQYPNADWRHHTLHYHGPDVEAWGMNAACLYFQLNKWDVQTLFWPAGYNSKIAVEADVLVTKLERFLSVDRTIHHDDAAQ